MKTANIITQKSSNKVWKDEKDLEVPYSRITKSERLMERQSNKLLTEALKMHKNLSEFKQQVRTICREVYDAYMTDNNSDITTKKGNFNWYNFDRTIKIEVSIHDQISFDDLGIIACKDKLDSFLSHNVASKNDFIKQLVLDAFETSRGRLDVKKVMTLLRYKSKIQEPMFQESMTLLENSIRRPKSKMYFRIWFKETDGSYQSVDLNFSSIN